MKEGVIVKCMWMWMVVKEEKGSDLNRRNDYLIFENVGEGVGMAE